MAPLKPTEILQLFNSINDVVPFLAPVKVIVDLMIQALEDIEDNTHQCCYLLQRCVNLLLCVNRKCIEGTVKEHKHAEHLNNLKRTLNKIRTSVEQIARKGPFQRFLQRHEIADSIRDAHSALDECLERFHLETVLSLTFIIEEHEDARRQDQDRLDHTLITLQNNDQDILKRLDVTREEIKEATRGLQDTLSRRISTVQRDFAANTLKLLAGRESVSSPTQSHEWAISSLEILIEDDVLGSGAFGKVYSGRWNGTRVAVKRLVDGTQTEILINEIEIWRRKQHPHIASFFRACIDSHPPLLVSEYYKFGNVLVYISNYPDCNRLRLCHQIALGMQFLHNEKVIHGDLKPANVLVDDAHRARITDFGLSRIKTSLTTQTLGDANGLILPRTPGTKVYMAPERLRQGTNTFSTDVYAWAMSAYQIFSDEAPFQYLPEEHLYECVVDRKIRPERPEGDVCVKRSLTDGVWELIVQSWADERRLRPQFKTISDSMAPWVSSELPTLSIPNQNMNRSQTALTPQSLKLRELLENMGLGDNHTGFGPQSGLSTSSSSPGSSSAENGLPAITSSQTLSPNLRDTVISGSNSKLDITTQYTSPSSHDTRLLNFDQFVSSSEKTSSKPPRKSRLILRSRTPKPPSPSFLSSSFRLLSFTKKKKNEITMSSMSTNQRKAYRITVIGDGGVGKSTLLGRFSHVEFRPTYDPTIEEHYQMVITIAGSQVELNLTDTSGQEEYASLRMGSYRFTDVALLCYSIISRNTFERLRVFISEFRRINPLAPMVFAGLKLDLENTDGRQVSRKEGEQVAKTYSSLFFECSSKSGAGVSELLMAVSTRGMEKF